MPNLSGVLCLEGAYEGDDLRDEKSVIAPLEMLRRIGLVKFVHKDVGTKDEVAHYLKRWIDEELDCYTLYLALHGTPGAIHLSTAPGGKISLRQLASMTEGALGDCLVHFGSCSVLAAEDEDLREYVGTTDAAVLTGYTLEIDWLPSALLDAAWLGSLRGKHSAVTALRAFEADGRYAALRQALGWKSFVNPKLS